MTPERQNNIFFDTRTNVGTACKTRMHQVKGYTIISFDIGIGKPDPKK